MSTEENKKISWRLQEEVFGQGRLESVDELVVQITSAMLPVTPS